MYKLLIISLLFLTLPISTMASSKSTDDICNNAKTTLDINECANDKLLAAEQQMQQYFNASLKENAQHTELITVMKNAQHQWTLYRDAECRAVYQQWQEGTIRVLMALSCKLMLTEQRTHALWQNYLSSLQMISNSDVLPEPISR